MNLLYIIQVSSYLLRSIVTVTAWHAALNARTNSFVAQKNNLTKLTKTFWALRNILLQRIPLKLCCL